MGYVSWAVDRVGWLHLYSRHDWCARGLTAFGCGAQIVAGGAHPGGNLVADEGERWGPDGVQGYRPQTASRWGLSPRRRFGSTHPPLGMKRSRIQGCSMGTQGFSLHLGSRAGQRLARHFMGQGAMRVMRAGCPSTSSTYPVPSHILHIVRVPLRPFSCFAYTLGGSTPRTGRPVTQVRDRRNLAPDVPQTGLGGLETMIRAKSSRPSAGSPTAYGRYLRLGAARRPRGLR